MSRRFVSLPTREESRLLRNFSRQSPTSTLPARIMQTPKNRLIKVYSKSPLQNFIAGDKDIDDDQKEKPTKSAKETDAHTHGQEIKNVPNPTPDTGIEMPVGYHPGVTFSVTPKTDHAFPTRTPASFVPLPSLLALPTNVHASSLPQTSTSSNPSSSAPALQNVSTQASQPKSHSQGPKLPVAAIAAIAAGSAFLLLGIFLVVKACSRPTRPTRPKPSLPILDDDYGNKKFNKEKDSPVFGGKERFSSQVGGIWTQPQPTHPASGNYAQLDDSSYHYNIPSSQSTWPAQSSLSSHNSRTHLMSPGPVPSQSVPALPTSHQPTRNNSFARAVSRFSSASLSLYPSSPINAQDIGIAISSSKAFTADGHPILKRSKSASRRTKSDFYDEKLELAYDGADVASPKVVQSPHLPTTSSGRTRIKSSYYAPGSYPRISTIPSSTSSKFRGDEPYENYPFPPMPKSDSRRDRDTSALTSALGLASPQPTLYPDDSLSVVGVKAPAKRIAVPKRREDEVPGLGGARRSELDSSTALGSLMLNMDFGGTNRSLATLAGRLGESTFESSATLAGRQSKPPRVPSPPPLPSLAQMGLEHNDPMGFSEYRSPTYSICGMYEEDSKRRSRTSSYR